MSIKPDEIRCFTGCVLPDVLQNKSPAGNESAPVLTVSGPFLCDIHSCQIQHFQKTVINGKYRFGFCYLETVSHVQPRYILRLLWFPSQKFSGALKQEIGSSQNG